MHNNTVQQKCVMKLDGEKGLGFADRKYATTKGAKFKKD